MCFDECLVEIYRVSVVHEGSTINFIEVLWYEPKKKIAIIVSNALKIVIVLKSPV